MTVELFPTEAPSGIELLIAWLIPLGVEVGPTRPSGAGLPYYMVTEAPGADDKIAENGIYSVHTFAGTFEEAETASRRAHRRMLALGPPLATQERVTLSDGRVVFADEVLTSRKPGWEDYGDNTIERFVARYAIKLRML